METPECQCGRGRQTAEHLFYECEDPKSAPLHALGFTMAAQVRAALSDPERVAVISKELIASGWLTEYQLAARLHHEEALEVAAAGITRKPPPELHKRRSRRPLAP